MDENESTSSISYSSDAPVQDPKDDRFDREPFARRIAETLVRRQDPASMVIAIYGAWGDGKTTVLNFIRDYLRKEQSVVCVNFNPWRLDGEDALLTGFFATLAEALDAELKTKTEKIGDLLKKYSFLLKPLPVVKELEGIASAAGSIMSSVSLDKLRFQISSILRESKKRVIVTIDDIDRLEKVEIQAIFRLVKLTADFDYVAYVLAFDEEMVAAAIGERYSSSASEYHLAGTKFLEKIVQVGLHLPPAGIDELREYAFDQVNEALQVSGVDLPQDDATEFSINFLMGLAPRLRTPRMAKRYGNALQFSLGILQGEIRCIDLMMIEGIRTFYPQFYLAIRDNKATLIKGEGRGGKFDIEKFVKENNPPLDSDEEKGLVRNLQMLFPRTRNVIHGPDWDVQWSRDKRICAVDYFDRCFSYAIRSNDVSDYALDELLNSGELNEADYQAKFVSTFTSKNASVFVSKLRDREENLPQNVVQRISMAIASNCSSLPSASGLAGLSRPFVQAAVFIARALKCLPASERFDVAKDVMRVSESPTFVAECMRWMSTNGEDDPKLLELEEETAMRQFGAETIVTSMERHENPFSSLPLDEIANVMNTLQWGLGDEKAREYASKWVEADPLNAIVLIRAYKGKGTNLETGLPVETHFFRQQYDPIVRLVDAEKLVKVLTSIYGDGLSAELSEDDEGLRLAKQFISMNANVQRQQTTAGAEG
jgi:predicted KAP-like P-loop ATPase